MAERSNVSSKKNQDVSTLQKRGRRRLVGAIALVLLAVIVLPMVFDPEPPQDAPPVSIRIPNEEGSKFTPKVAPKPAVPQPESPAAPQSAQPASSAKPEQAAAVQEPSEPKAVLEPKVQDKKVPVPAPKPAEKPTQSPPASTSEQFVVQVGAFASPEKVKERIDQLKEAGLPHYTETIATANGTVTRIRLGPYPSKETAEKARERAKALGLSPANPLPK